MTMTKLGEGSSHAEEDNLRHLVTCFRLLHRDKIQRIIFKVVLSLLITYNVGFLVYLYYWTPGLEDILKQLPTQIPIIHVQIMFTHITSQRINVAVNEESVMVFLKHRRGCSKTFRKHLDKIASTAIFWSSVTVILVVITLVLHTPWYSNVNEFYFGLLIIRQYFGESTLLVIFSYIILLYSSFYAFSIYSISLYGCSHLRMQLMILSRKWTEFNLYCSRYDKDITYQNTVNMKLRSFWIHYLDIKRFKDQIHEFSFWPIFSSFFNVIFSLGTITINLLMIGIEKNYWMISMVCLLVFESLLMAEYAQLVENESEKLYFLVQSSHWNGWNEENCNFLRMFLMLTRDPLTINNLGIIGQNRILALKIFKGIYTIVAFYRSVNK